VRLLADPRDIALAIRVQPGHDDGNEVENSAGELDEGDMRELEVMLSEVGLELVDESAVAEDDDERREPYVPSTRPDKIRDAGYELIRDNNSYITAGGYSPDTHDSPMAQYGPKTSEQGFT
jgi:hypothetical protein